ncbi:MAG: SH3 domain-containing protein [Maritimibacter sp.]|nr:SH3 domain-containing protein [Maritimibacter sp.]
MPAPAPEPVAPEPPAPSIPEEPQGALYVAGSGVIVRAGPSAEERAVDDMMRGTAVVDLGGVGEGWRMILLPNGAAGYIAAADLSLTPIQ